MNTSTKTVKKLLASAGLTQTLSILMQEVEREADQHAGTEYGYGLRDVLSALDSATVRAACADSQRSATEKRG